jgi:hypothetical protein
VGECRCRLCFGRVECVEVVVGGEWGNFQPMVAGQEDGRTKAIRQRGNLLTLPLQMAGCVILIRAGANGEAGEVRKGTKFQL